MRYWLPALAWLATVMFLSGESLAATNTGAFLKGLLRALGLELSDGTLLFIHIAIRKSAHVCVYAVLSALWFRAWRSGSPGWRMQWALLALAVCLLTASADETRQAFTPGRGGSPWDVALDMSGAALAQGLIAICLRRQQMKRAAP